MLLVISPAKSLDFSQTSPQLQQISSTPGYLQFSLQLVELLKKLPPQQIGELMSISDKLALLNFQRFQDWQLPYPVAAAKPAVLAFAGDVYHGLTANTWSIEDLQFAQQHLVILSGLYGILRPLDNILPYRLEMSTALANCHGKDLYSFWGDKLRLAIELQLSNMPNDVEPFLINVASQEYFKVLQEKKLQVEVLEVIFQNQVKGKYKIVSFYAKKARGLFANFVIKNRIKERRFLSQFAADGYNFYAEGSTPKCLIFRRALKDSENYNM